MDLNKVLLVGRLGAKPEMRKDEYGAHSYAQVVTRRVVSHGTRTTQESVWHHVVACDDNAEKFRNLARGTLVFVEGRLKDGIGVTTDGKFCHRTEILVHTILLLDDKPTKARTGRSK